MTPLDLPPGIEQALEQLPPIVSPGGFLIYGVTAVVLMILVANLVQWKRRRTADELELADVLDEETIESGRVEDAAFDDLAEQHQSAVAPAAIKWDTRAVKIGDRWTSTLYVAAYPDAPVDGYLAPLFELMDVEFDVTAHITPKNQERARSELQNVADDLRADADLDRTVRQRYLRERAEEAAAGRTAASSCSGVPARPTSSPWRSTSG